MSVNPLDHILYDQNLTCHDRASLCVTDRRFAQKCRERRHLVQCAEELLIPSVFEIRKRIDSKFHPRVRAAALLALGALGEHAKDHVDAVAEKINDPHAVVKEASPIF